MAKHILDGTLVQVGEEQTFKSGFAKVEAIFAEGGSELEADQIPIEFVRSPRSGIDGIELLTRCQVGDLVRVTYELRGREWQGRHFVNLSATSIQLLSSAPVESNAPQQATLPNVPPPTPQEPAPPAPEQPGEYRDSLDDLPF